MEHALLDGPGGTISEASYEKDAWHWPRLCGELAQSLCLEPQGPPCETGLFASLARPASCLWRPRGATERTRPQALGWPAPPVSSSPTFQDSPKAVFFSATMRSNSLRSRGDGFGRERAMRVTRWATTCGTANASSAAWVASDWAARLRRVAMDSFADETTTAGLCCRLRRTSTVGGFGAWKSNSARTLRAPPGGVKGQR